MTRSAELAVPADNASKAAKAKNLMVLIEVTSVALSSLPQLPVTGRSGANLCDNSALRKRGFCCSARRNFDGRSTTAVAHCGAGCACLCAVRSQAAARDGQRFG